MSQTQPRETDAPRPWNAGTAELRSIVRAVIEPRTWLTTGYLLLTTATGTFWFTVLTFGLAFGFGFALVWVGVLLLAVLPLVWRLGARLERRVAGFALGVEITRPYRPAPQGSLLARGRALVADPATWKDLAYLVLLFPLGIVWASITVLTWGTALTLLAAPLYYTALPAGRISWLGLDDLDVVVDSLPAALLAALVGLVLTVPAAWIVRGTGAVHAQLARALLGPSQAQSHAAEAIRLRQSRDLLAEAAAAERNRIERDLHDGAQQRLISLAMHLGMAKQALAREPGSAEALVERAHQEAKQAVAELRDLARGIHPAILDDRGLDASLSALAAQSVVPVDIAVDLPQRPPASTEAIAYFVVAEALANATKYASPSRVWVRVDDDAGRVRVEVHDDGVGGAQPRPGAGLAGLRTRVGAAGGTLEVSSPPGGPTVIRAEVPCGS